MLHGCVCLLGWEREREFRLSLSLSFSLSLFSSNTAQTMQAYLLTAFLSSSSQAHDDFKSFNGCYLLFCGYIYVLFFQMWNRWKDFFLLRSWIVFVAHAWHLRTYFRRCCLLILIIYKTSRCAYGRVSRCDVESYATYSCDVVVVLRGRRSLVSSGLTSQLFFWNHNLYLGCSASVFLSARANFLQSPFPCVVPELTWRHVV